MVAQWLVQLTQQDGHQFVYWLAHSLWSLPRVLWLPPTFWRLPLDMSVGVKSVCVEDKGCTEDLLAPYTNIIKE